MMTISFLDKATIARLAAGEIASSPAGVVRELLDNSIDSGARQIDIRWRSGGISEIMVSDDGCGIDPESLRLASMKHATSKRLRKDLSAETLGFRGEALYSIKMAYKTLEITSKIKKEDHAWNMTWIAGQDVPGPNPSPGTDGTRVKVTDMYWNLPVRLKFLASPSMESAKICEVIREKAWLNPGIDFRYGEYGEETHYARLGAFLNSPEKIVAAVFKEHLDTKKIVLKILDERIQGDIVISFISKRSTKSKLAVNGRTISNKILTDTITNSIRRVVGTEERFCFFANLHIREDLVDWHIHPEKRKIRLRSDFGADKILREAITSGLKTAGYIETQSITSTVEGIMNNAMSKDIPPGILGKPIGQAHKSWIICETESGIALIDQHAAHERLIMETIMKGGKFPPLEITPPESFCCSPREAELLRAASEQLEAIGFILSIKDTGAEVSGCPNIPGLKNTREFAARTLDAILELGATDGAEASIRELVAERSCKNAIKIGDGLTPEEMTAFIRLMEKNPESFRCNHGRPSVIFLSNSDMEKFFFR